MVGNSLRALWDEPRPADPPQRVWRDWALLGVAVSASLIEAVLRPDQAWLLVTLAVSIVVALSLLWRRTRPLAAVAAGFGTLLAFDLARIVAIDATALVSIAAALILPYALFRWGSGQEAALGLGVILVWLGVTHVADPTDAADVVAGYGFFLFSAALGASIRYHANTRLRAIDEAKLRERAQLARDLHDTVAHHVSGIAIQAQAGRAVAATSPERAIDSLGIIEEAASRTLTEMRAIVGVLRESDEPDLAPQPRVGDIGRLVAGAGDGPRIEVELSGDLDDLSPVVGVAAYRLAQESITNARRHAHQATRVTVRVVGDDRGVHLTVADDGVPSTTAGSGSGYGLIGMRERVTLLGGTFDAGPAADRGWRVDATLPRARAAR